MEELQKLITGWDWGTAISTWLLVVLVISLAVFVVGGFFSGLSRSSLVDGYVAALRRTTGFFADVAAISARRLWAIAWHSVLESIRRRVLLVFAVFAVLFLFAGWYLNSRPTEQVKVYVSFVFQSSTLIAMIVALLLAAMSLPNDIKLQTIHTVVTKPVRRLEIVIGRTLGLIIVATGLLVVMGAVSFIYLTRSVNNSLAQLEAATQKAEQKGDTKQVETLKDEIAQIRSKLTARIPVYGKLKMEGVNVGHEDMFRSYIPGNVPEAVANWNFHGIPVAQLTARKKIPLELTFTVFRTYKGVIGQGVLAELTYLNPKNGRRLVDYPFVVREYYVNQQSLDDRPDRPRRLFLRDQPLPTAPADPVGWLLEGCGGELVIEARCLSSAQYLGMAQPDLYILLDEGNFGVNFAKGIIGIWLRVVLIISAAVMFSTFLSGMVTILATAAFLVGGSQMDFLRRLATGAAQGGGPIEAMKRLLTHDNLEKPMDPGFWTSAIKGMDAVVVKGLLRALTYVVPDLGIFNTTPLVANGFDISALVLVQHVVGTLAYVIPFMIVGYFLLQSREIAR